jgi:hypothetical protein
MTFFGQNLPPQVAKPSFLRLPEHPMQPEPGDFWPEITNLRR